MKFFNINAYAICLVVTIAMVLLRIFDPFFIETARLKGIDYYQNKSVTTNRLESPLSMALFKEKLDNFSQLDIRVDKKWNKENISISFYFEILNILTQKIPLPPEYGLNRDSNGDIIMPMELTEVDINRNTPIPTFGFSLDF